MEDGKMVNKDNQDTPDLERMMLELVASAICFGAATSEDEERIHSKSIEDWKAAIRAHLRSTQAQEEPRALAPDSDALKEMMSHMSSVPPGPEEPSGAPAPVPTYFQVVRALTNLHVDYCAKNCRGKDRHVDYCRELSEFVGKTYGAPESQPPAPASPGRECWVLFGPSGGSEAVRSLDKINERTMALANGLGWKWVRMVEAPAAPEAGAPGTQGPKHKGWCYVFDADPAARHCTCDAEPPTQTQEGGSQP